jgi:hypothetical protein
MPAPAPTFLSEADWEAYGLRLLAFTRYWAGVHYGWTEGRALPTGRTPEDIVIEVLLAYHEGRRTITAGVATYVQLKSSVKSVLWNLHRSHGSRRVTRLTPEDFALLMDESPNPDSSVQVEDFWRAFFEALLSQPHVAKRSDMQALVRAFQGGAESIGDLAAATGMTEERISELKRQLRPIAEKAMAHLKKEGTDRESKSPEGCHAAT